jgi:hypothetical protein
LIGRRKRLVCKFEVIANIIQSLVKIAVKQLNLASNRGTQRKEKCPKGKRISKRSQHGKVGSP